MKRIVKITSVILLILLTLSSLTFAGKSQTASITKGTPKIDGKGDDMVWKKAANIEIRNLTADSKFKDANHATGKAKILWDESNIYIFIEVKDKTLIKNSEIDQNSDSVEYYIDADNSKGKQYKPVNNAMYRLNIDARITGWGDYDRNIFKKQAKVVKVSGGYNQEVAIPLSSHGIKTAKAGMKIGFDIQINDNAAGKERNYTISWCQENGLTDPSTLGTVMLR